MACAAARQPRPSPAKQHARAVSAAPAPARPLPPPQQQQKVQHTSRRRLARVQAPRRRDGPGGGGGEAAVRAAPAAAATAAPGPAARGPVVVVDNYDSFTYNLCQVPGAVCVCVACAFAQRGATSVDASHPPRPPPPPLAPTHAHNRAPLLPPPQYLGDLGCDHVVFPNDARSVEEIRAMNPRGILVSPGPGVGGRACGLVGGWVGGWMGGSGSWLAAG